MPQYFQNITTLPALERERRRLAKLHHPDVAGGSHTVMQEINAEYERARDRLSSPPPPPGNIAYTYPCPRQQGKPQTYGGSDDSWFEQAVNDAINDWLRDEQTASAQSSARQQYRSQVDRQRQKLKEESEVEEDDDDYSGD
jgi:curved DNA-binding protein CbpA